MLIRGRLERSEGVVTTIVAEHLVPLPMPGNVKSCDFR